MHLLLQARHREAARIERFFHALRQLTFDIPVIVRPHPRPTDMVHRTCTQFVWADIREGGEEIG